MSKSGLSVKLTLSGEISNLNVGFSTELTFTSLLGVLLSKNVVLIVRLSAFTLSTP